MRWLMQTCACTLIEDCGNARPFGQTRNRGRRVALEKRIVQILDTQADSDMDADAQRRNSPGTLLELGPASLCRCGREKSLIGAIAI